MMQLKGLFVIGALGLTSSLSLAGEVNCTTLANPQARQKCGRQKAK